MKNILIISNNENGIDSIKNILKKEGCEKITIAKTCGEGQRRVLSQYFDLVLINSPVLNESGESFAKALVAKTSCQVIFFVRSSSYGYISNRLGDYGIITLPKPIDKTLLWQAIKIAKATDARLKNMQKETNKLAKKIEDIKVIDRAKYILITYLNISEEEAHKHIEKKAMDTRLSKREVAENILKVYEV